MKPHVASRIGKFDIPDRPRPVTHDSCFRYWVWSRTEPGKKYLIEIDDYGFNGSCQCGSFAFNFEKYLRAGITPQEAVARKLVELKPKQRIADALRCPHIIEALVTFAEDMGRAVDASQKAQTRNAYAQKVHPASHAA